MAVTPPTESEPDHGGAAEPCRAATRITSRADLLYLAGTALIMIPIAGIGGALVMLLVYLAFYPRRQGAMTDPDGQRPSGGGTPSQLFARWVHSVNWRGVVSAIAPIAIGLGIWLAVHVSQDTGLDGAGAQFAAAVRDRAPRNTWIDDHSDEGLVDLGRQYCGQLNAGTTLDELFMQMTFGFPDFNDQYAAGVVLGAAIEVFCPQHSSALQSYLDQWQGTG